jgi:uncharacterized membrane-anchored protein YhcB (DUF1043 family)
MHYISIAQTSPSSQSSGFPPPWYLTTFGGIIIGACFTYLIQKSIARYNSNLTQQREKEKKLDEKMEELEEMKNSQKILEAINALRTDLLGEISDQGKKLTGEISAQGVKIDELNTRLTGKIDEQGKILTGKIDELDTRLTGKIDEVKTELAHIKYNQGLLVQELRIRGIISETPVLK